MSQGCWGLELSSPADLGLLMQNTWPGLLVTRFLSVCLTQELFGRNGFEYMLRCKARCPGKIGRVSILNNVPVWTSALHLRGMGHRQVILGRSFLFCKMGRYL